MKFGETIYQLSVPKWAAYNLNYNELKSLIKAHTTGGSSAAPIGIPGVSRDRWAHLEQELFEILQEQYNNIGLFLRSKYGEIERRLSHLERQVRATEKSLVHFTGPSVSQARKYQRLVQEADAIGEDIQALTRFAATQKTAFRKILKKYRKRTGSTTLQTRMEKDVFSDGKLALNMTQSMQRLSKLLSTMSQDLEGPMMRGEPRRARKARISSTESSVSQINKAAQSGPLHFDAVLPSVPFGEAAGTATYWIHPDNLEEAKVLLLKYMRDLKADLDAAADEADDSAASSHEEAWNGSAATETCSVVFCDNVQRYIRDTSTSCATKVALTTRWTTHGEAAVSMSDLKPQDKSCSTLRIKKKNLPLAFDRNRAIPQGKDSNNAASIRAVKDYLSEHRDVKLLAGLRSERSRYAGITNSAEVGIWATLDTNVCFWPANIDDLGHSSTHSSTESFPYVILELRWEFIQRPEVVRAFDATHLTEKVHDFVLEDAAIHSQQPTLQNPSWTETLKRDIRKVPLSRLQTKNPNALLHSGPSSTATEGPADSIFSVARNSTAGSETSPMASSRDLSSPTQAKSAPQRQKKRARIQADSPRRDGDSSTQQRYYSEYDDPNSELYQEQEAYTIYVDPDASFLGAETVKKITKFFTSPFRSTKVEDDPRSGTEQEPLLKVRTKPKLVDHESLSSDESDSDPTITAHSVPHHTGLQGHVRPAERYRQRLSRRQRTFETTVTRLASGLLLLSYVFLVMSTIILITGRKRTLVQVDAGAVVGVVAALVCTIISLALVYMRKSKLGKLQMTWLVVGVGGVVLLGAAVVLGIIHRATRVKK